MDTQAEQGEQRVAAQDGSASTATGGPVLPATDAWYASQGAFPRRQNADAPREDEDERPTVEHAAWLKRDDYWRRTTYIAVTGRQTAAAPATRPLPRPHRFRRPSPVRSALILLLTLALIVLIPIGVVIAQRVAETHIKLPTSIPGITQPEPTLTTTPIATVKPTATPKKK